MSSDLSGMMGCGITLQAKACTGGSVETEVIGWYATKKQPIIVLVSKIGDIFVVPLSRLAKVNLEE